MAAVRLVDHLALAFEDLECFADRNAADTEPLGESVLTKRLSGQELPCDDCAPKLGKDESLGRGRAPKLFRGVLANAATAKTSAFTPEF